MNNYVDAADACPIALLSCFFHLTFFLDPEHLEQFEKYLQSMNCSEEICLLTTFAQMAQTKRADVDEDFIKIIVLEIYEVSNVTGPFRKRMKILFICSSGRCETFMASVVCSTMELKKPYF